MPVDRDGEGPPLRRDDAKTSGRAPDDLRATPFTDDVFDDDYYGRRRKGGAFGLIVGVVFGAALAAFAGWYVLGTREASVANGAPGSGGLVRAESMPYKVKPEDPGGLQVENQDKLVYERLDKSTKPVERVENLLPAPEQPKAPPVRKPDTASQPPQPTATATPKDDPLAKLVAKVEGVKETPPADKPVSPAPVAEKPMTPASPAAMSADKPMTSASPAAMAEKPMTSASPAAVAAEKPMTPEPPAPKAEPVAAAPTPAPAPAPTPPSAPPVVTNAPQPATVAPAPTVVADAPQAAPAAVPAVRSEAATPAAVPPGAMFLQLASARSEDAALGEWKRISAKNGDIIGTLTPSVVVADLGDRGKFYRLRAGPVTDKATADGLCASLASRNVGCIVVRP